MRCPGSPGSRSPSRAAGTVVPLPEGDRYLGLPVRARRHARRRSRRRCARAARRLGRSRSPPSLERCASSSSPPTSSGSSRARRERGGVPAGARATTCARSTCRSTRGIPRWSTGPTRWRSRCRCTPPPAWPVTSPAAIDKPVRAFGLYAEQCHDFATPVAWDAVAPGPRPAPAARPLRPARDRRRAAPRRRRSSRRTAARTGAGTARCRSCSTAASAASTRTRCSPTSRSSSPPVRATSRSAIPTSSTRRRTRAASCAAMHERFPDVTFDCTVKVEHVLAARRRCGPSSPPPGCVFVVSAFESVDDAVLDTARQGPHHRRRRPRGRDPARRRHRGAAVVAAVHAVDHARRRDRAARLRVRARPRRQRRPGAVQRAPAAPRGLAAARPPRPRPVRSARGTPSARPTPGRHPDPAVDDAPAAHRRRSSTARMARRPGRRSTRRVREAAGAPPVDLSHVTTGRPRLTESWFCCAEPTDLQLTTRLERASGDSSESCC